MSWKTIDSPTMPPPELKLDYGSLYYQQHGDRPLHALIDEGRLIKTGRCYYMSFVLDNYMGTIELLDMSQVEAERVYEKARTEGLIIYAREDLKYWANSKEWVVPFRLEKASEPSKSDADFERMLKAQQRRLKRAQKRQSDMHYKTFAECVETEAGFTIQHKETKWAYTGAKPTEIEAWQELQRIAIALGKGVSALLELTPIVTMRLEPGTQNLIRINEK